jgi:DNA polymerase-3 subunit epsilon
MGVITTKQEFIAYKTRRIFYEAHRALVDAEVLLDIVQGPAHDGRSVLANIIDAAATPTYRVWAVNSPFEAKDRLKTEGGYYWSDGTEPGKLKSWFKDGVVDLDAELAFLATIYPRPAKVTVDAMTAEERFSARYRSRVEVDIKPATSAKPKP